MRKIKASAAVLIGGKSRRYGVDKVKLLWDGIPVPVSLYLRLSKTLHEVFFIAGHRKKIAGFDLPVYPDRLPGNGPLGGIHAALIRAKFDYTFVTAGDLPFLDADLVTLLFNELKNEEALIPVSGTGIEPLAAFYHRSCAPLIENDLKNGQREVRSILPRIHTRFLDLSRYYSPSRIKKIFFNINHPGDYEQALKMI